MCLAYRLWVKHVERGWKCEGRFELSDYVVPLGVAGKWHQQFEQDDGQGVNVYFVVVFSRLQLLRTGVEQSSVLFRSFSSCSFLAATN